MIVEKDGLDGPHFFLVPKSDVQVLDDWDTMALEGTGSKSFVVTDKFIPAHRFLDGRLSRSGTGPGTAVNKAAVYRAPRFGGTAAAGFSALAVGMARGVFAEWLALTGPRTSRGVAVGAQQGTQILAARSAAEIDAAHALYQTTVRGGMRKLEEGGTESSAERLTGRRNIAFACQLALKAGTRLFNAGGGRALYLKGAMQRQYRNLLGAVAHRGVNWEPSAVGLRRRAARAARRAAAGAGWLRFRANQRKYEDVLHRRLEIGDDVQDHRQQRRARAPAHPGQQQPDQEHLEHAEPVVLGVDDREEQRNDHDRRAPRAAATGPSRER